MAKDSLHFYMQGTPREPFVAEQRITIGATAVSSNAFQDRTKLIDVISDVYCHIRINGTADATDKYLKPGEFQRFGVPKNGTISVIDSIITDPLLDSDNIWNGINCFLGNVVFKANVDFTDATDVIELVTITATEPDITYTGKISVKTGVPAPVIAHGLTSGKLDDTHTLYLNRNGVRPMTGPLTTKARFRESTALLNANYTVLDSDHRIDFKITTAVTRRVTLPDPTTNKDRELVIDNHYGSHVGSLIDFDKTVDNIPAGSYTVAQNASVTLFSDGIEWRETA